MEILTSVSPSWIPQSVLMLLCCFAAATMAAAPSPRSFLSRLTEVNALLNNQTNGQNQTELSQYASDQHETKSSVMGSSRRVHLRLRKRGGNGLGAASLNLIVVEIEAGQRPVDL